MTLSIAGLFLVAFAVVALTGPGRIDIIDGQTRYEVARSLVEHGDVVIRDPGVWYPIAPGRDGKTYTNYRLPHSLLGVPAILLADATGPVREARRHFFFSLINAVSVAACVAAYVIWFRRAGYSMRSAACWAMLGLLATPLWYYSTSTFDDVLGTAFVLWGLLAAAESRRKESVGWCLIASAAIGIAINCKQPLGIFLLPMLVATIGGDWRDSAARQRVLIILAGAFLGAVTWWAFEFYKFPPGTGGVSSQYSPPVWHTEILTAALVLLVSPAAGVIWYSPAVILSFAGAGVARRHDRWLANALALACLGFFLFICCLGFFKGDIGWGPRYLTPVLAVLWLWAPAGAARVGRARTAFLVSFAVVVQFLSLAHDPHRLYVRNEYQPIINIARPWQHFDLRSSHLLYRPVEIAESLMSLGQPERFSPAPCPTCAPPPPDELVNDPSCLTRYEVFRSLRPWWACEFGLPPSERPVDLSAALIVLSAVMLCGATLLYSGLRHDPGESP